MGMNNILRTFHRDMYAYPSDHVGSAMQVRQQPAGTYTSQEHFVRVLPIFLVPSTEWGLYLALRWVLRWVEARDRAKITSLQAKLKKMVNELKVSCPGS